MNKKILLYSLAIGLMCSTAVAQESDSIAFQKETWKHASSDAKEQNKYLFVDAYTDWCYWCKVMDKKTFPDNDVAKLINGEFIPLKMNMEKGVGVELAMKYRVFGFPTFLVFGPDGKLVHRFSGYREPADFIKELTASMDPEKQLSTEGISDKMDPGFPGFYKNAFTGYSKKKSSPTKEDVAKFLDKQDDLMSEVSWSVMMRFGTGEELEKHFWENYDGYKKQFGAVEVENRKWNIYGSMYGRAVKEEDTNLNIGIIH